MEIIGNPQAETSIRRLNCPASWSTVAFLKTQRREESSQAAAYSKRGNGSRYVKMAALDSPQRLNATGAYVRSIKAYAAVDASAEAESSSLNGHGIFAVIVFATVMFIVIQPVRVPIPLAISIWVGGKWQRLTGQRVCNLKGDGSSLPSNLSASSVIESDQSPVAQPFPQRKYLVLNNVSAPVAGILVLLATKTIGGEIIKLGIVGSKGVEPYDALLLFLGLGM